MANDKVRVSLQGSGNIKQAGNGYEVKLANSARGDVAVVVQAEIDGTWMEMGRQSFRVKPLPAPYVRFGSIKGSGKMTADEAALQFLKAEYSSDFPFDLPVAVQSFKMFTVKDNGNVVEKISNNNRLTNEMKEYIKQLRPGGQIIFEDIVAKGQDGVSIPVSPIVVTIKR